MPNTDPNHVKGSHPHQAAHAAKGLVFYALKADGTWSGPYTSRSAANPTSDATVTVLRRNPHLTPAQETAQDAVVAAPPSAS